MKQTYYSIFNDALGPIMTGPSSSHSAGCNRIGQAARALFGRDIEKADVVFEKNGSYPSTYIGQGSDFGFTGGLLGFPTDDVRLKDAVSIAAREGRQIVFRKESLGLLHPNQAEIRIYGENGDVLLTLMTFSVGGGMFRITKLNGYDVEIDGTEERAYLAVPAEQAHAIEALLKGQYPIAVQTVGDDSLITVELDYGVDTSSLENVAKNPAVRAIYRVPVLLPVSKSKKHSAPFYNAEEALSYAVLHNRTPWQLALDYECGYGNATEDELWAYVRHIREVMEASAIPPSPDRTRQYGFLPYQAEKMSEHLAKTPLIDTGLLHEAMMAAIAVMENSCAHNIIVASPTAGSSGVVPASIVTIGKRLGKTEREIEKALLVAGLVGVFIANQATFGGEVGACQAENGSASAMAAAGVTELLGGTANDCFAAASMALQNSLGLICDPIAGLTEIPCISRNVSSMANAVLSANMVLLGFDPVVPLDEVIETMKRVGEQIPRELRCTCEGGLCTTPTGCRLQKRMDDKRVVL